MNAARLKGLKGLENDIKKKGLPPLGGKDRVLSDFRFRKTDTEAVTRISTFCT